MRIMMAVAAMFSMALPASTDGASAAGRPNPPTIDQSGARRSFQQVLDGQVTVLHFMYPTCPSFCPVSGEMLSRTQDLLMKARPNKAYRIVSVSILPRETTPARLTGWLQKHRAKPGWVALYVGPGDIGGLMRYYGETAIDVQLHSSQVLVLNSHGQLVKRFDDLPHPSQLAAAVRFAAR
ncbi:MAG: SCO family protein [Candidatus Sphingomonas phytovorans]|nr:SCO family protein [Sphingomonas sp.]WEK00151.1 MAG: SCO family protein [Sphingomonas sp.]